MQHKNTMQYGMLAIGLVLGAMAAADETASSGDSQVLEEVVVTAQRRSESLKDVPLTVTSTTAAELANLGITSTRELTEVVPGTVMGMKGNFVQPAIRGITTQGTGPGIESNVPIYLDGVYMPSQTANVFDLADVSRLEVLKGPQGTLFGRNATGGAIRIFTQAPSFTENGKISLGYGSFEDVRTSGYITGPLIGDQLAGSLSLYYHSNEGYVHDVDHGGYLAGVDSKLVRGKLLYRPTDWMSFTLSAFAMNSKDPTGFAMQPLNGNTVARRFNPRVYLSTNPRNASLNAAIAESKVISESLTSQFDFSSGTLSAITSGLHSHFTGVLDGDATNYSALTYYPDNPDDSFTQEVTFASKKYQRFSFLAGAFAFIDNAKYSPSGALVFGKRVDVYGRIETHAYAGFGEVNFDITDAFTAIAGVRYSWEHRDYAGARLTPVLTEYGNHTWTAATPRFVLKYAITPATNVYASFSRGFTSGTYGPTSLSSVPVNPEKINAFEVGAKTAFDRFTFNAAAYYYKYTDLQVSAVVGTFTRLQNAATAHIYGVDLDGAAQLGAGFRLRSGASFLHGEFAEFRNASVNVPNPACPVTAPCGDVTVSKDVSGYQLPKAPRFTGNLALEYEHALFGGKTTLGTTYYYNSGFPWESGGRVRQGAYGTLAANIAWAPGSERYRVMVWGKNLTNRDYLQSEFDTAGGDEVVYAAPRWLGVTVNVNF